MDQAVEAGLLDEVMARVDAGELQLTGEGGFLQSTIKAVLERGLHDAPTRSGRPDGVEVRDVRIRDTRPMEGQDRRERPCPWQVSGDRCQSHRQPRLRHRLQQPDV